jgi:predicted acylesterase/phospholipase RssA
MTSDLQQIASVASIPSSPLPSQSQQLEKKKRVQKKDTLLQFVFHPTILLTFQIILFIASIYLTFTAIRHWVNLFTGPLYEQLASQRHGCYITIQTLFPPLYDLHEFNYITRIPLSVIRFFHHIFVTSVSLGYGFGSNFVSLPPLFILHQLGTCFTIIFTLAVTFARFFFNQAVAVRQSGAKPSHLRKNLAHLSRAIKDKIYQQRLKLASKQSRAKGIQTDVSLTHSLVSEYLRARKHQNLLPNGFIELLTGGNKNNSIFQQLGDNDNSIAGISTSYQYPHSSDNFDHNTGNSAQISDLSPLKRTNRHHRRLPTIDQSHTPSLNDVDPNTTSSQNIMNISFGTSVSPSNTGTNDDFLDLVIYDQYSDDDDDDDDDDEDFEQNKDDEFNRPSGILAGGPTIAQKRPGSGAFHNLNTEGQTTLGGANSTSDETFDRFLDDLEAINKDGGFKQLIEEAEQSYQTELQKMEQNQLEDNKQIEAINIDGKESIIDELPRLSLKTFSGDVIVPSSQSPSSEGDHHDSNESHPQISLPTVKENIVSQNTKKSLQKLKEIQNNLFIYKEWYTIFHLLKLAWYNDLHRTHHDSTCPVHVYSKFYTGSAPLVEKAFNRLKRKTMLQKVFLSTLSKIRQSPPSQTELPRIDPHFDQFDNDSHNDGEIIVIPPQYVSSQITQPVFDLLLPNVSRQFAPFHNIVREITSLVAVKNGHELCTQDQNANYLYFCLEGECWGFVNSLCVRHYLNGSAVGVEAIHCDIDDEDIKPREENKVKYLQTIRVGSNLHFNPNSLTPSSSFSPDHTSSQSFSCSNSFPKSPANFHSLTSTPPITPHHNITFGNTSISLSDYGIFLRIHYRDWHNLMKCNPVVSHSTCSGILSRVAHNTQIALHQLLPQPLYDINIGVTTDVFGKEQCKDMVNQLMEAVNGQVPQSSEFESESVIEGIKLDEKCYQRDEHNREKYHHHKEYAEINDVPNFPFQLIRLRPGMVLDTSTSTISRYAIDNVSREHEIFSDQAIPLDFSTSMPLSPEYSVTKTQLPWLVDVIRRSSINRNAFIVLQGNPAVHQHAFYRQEIALPLKDEHFSSQGEEVDIYEKIASGVDGKLNTQRMNDDGDHSSIPLNYFTQYQEPNQQNSPAPPTQPHNSQKRVFSSVSSIFIKSGDLINGESLFCNRPADIVGIGNVPATLNSSVNDPTKDVILVVINRHDLDVYLRHLEKQFYTINKNTDLSTFLTNHPNHTTPSHDMNISSNPLAVLRDTIVSRSLLKTYTSATRLLMIYTRLGMRSLFKQSDNNIVNSTSPLSSEVVFLVSGKGLLTTQPLSQSHKLLSQGNVIPETTTTHIKDNSKDHEVVVCNCNQRGKNTFVSESFEITKQLQEVRQERMLRHINKSSSRRIDEPLIDKLKTPPQTSANSLHSITLTPSNSAQYPPNHNNNVANNVSKPQPKEKFDKAPIYGREQSTFRLTTSQTSIDTQIFQMKVSTGQTVAMFETLSCASVLIHQSGNNPKKLSTTITNELNHYFLTTRELRGKTANAQEERLKQLKLDIVTPKCLSATLNTFYKDRNISSNLRLDTIRDSEVIAFSFTSLLLCSNQYPELLTEMTKSVLGLSQQLSPQTLHYNYNHNTESFQPLSHPVGPLSTKTGQLYTLLDGGDRVNSDFSLVHLNNSDFQQNCFNPEVLDEFTTRQISGRHHVFPHKFKPHDNSNQISVMSPFQTVCTQIQDTLKQTTSVLRLTSDDVYALFGYYSYRHRFNQVLSINIPEQIKMGFDAHTKDELSNLELAEARRCALHQRKLQHNLRLFLFNNKLHSNTEDIKHYRLGLSFNYLERFADIILCSVQNTSSLDNYRYTELLNHKMAALSRQNDPKQYHKLAKDKSSDQLIQSQHLLNVDTPKRDITMPMTPPHPHPPHSGEHNKRDVFNQPHQTYLYSHQLLSDVETGDGSDYLTPVSPPQEQSNQQALYPHFFTKKPIQKQQPPSNSGLVSGDGNNDNKINTTVTQAVHDVWSIRNAESIIIVQQDLTCGNIGFCPFHKTYHQLSAPGDPNDHNMSLQGRDALLLAPLHQDPHQVDESIAQYVYPTDPIYCDPYLGVIPLERKYVLQHFKNQIERQKQRGVLNPQHLFEKYTGPLISTDPHPIYSALSPAQQYIPPKPTVFVSPYEHALVWTPRPSTSRFASTHSSADPTPNSPSLNRTNDQGQMDSPRYLGRPVRIGLFLYHAPCIQQPLYSRKYIAAGPRRCDFVVHARLKIDDNVSLSLDSPKNYMLTTYTVEPCDIERLSRRLLGNSISLVCGGGGARGISHIGAMFSILEKNASGPSKGLLNVDVLAGTSQGAWAAALFSTSHPSLYYKPGSFKGRELPLLNLEVPNTSKLSQSNITSLSPLFYRALNFCQAMSQLSTLLSDATFPLLSYFSGGNFNNLITSSLGFHGDVLHVDDTWIEICQNSTNISRAGVQIHRDGPLWHSTRASMNVIPLLPPVIDKKTADLHIDGGYVNNLLANVAYELFQPKYIISVDVENKDEQHLQNISSVKGATLSGWTLLWMKLKRMFIPISNPKDYFYPSYSDLIASLMYVSHGKHQHSVHKWIDVYVRPQVQQYQLLDYDKADAIIITGKNQAEAELNIFIESRLIIDHFKEEFLFKSGRLGKL